MPGYGAAIIALAVCLGGCGARSGNEAAGANTAAPGGPCPFETRNVRAAVETGSGTPSVWIRLEHRADTDRRQPAAIRRQTPPPDLVLDLETDPQGMQSEGREWGESGVGGYPATPDYTRAVVRCRGTEVARVPIQR
jgi:hypothetical protein